MPMIVSKYLFSKSSKLVKNAKLILGTSLVLLSSFAANAQDKEWELKREKDGVSLYLRDYPNSSIPEFKGVITVESSMASIVSLLLDIESCPEWVHQCGESFPIEVISAKEQYVYQMNKLPFVRDRDIILRATLEYLDHAKLITIQMDSEADYCNDKNIEACNKIDGGKYVRVRESSGNYQLQQLNAQKIKITWRQHIDPGGRLPNWLIRSQIADFPIHTLKNLKKMIEKEKYQNKNIVIENRYLNLVEKNKS